MTEKLFWKNAYETKFTAKVKTTNGDGIILDRTLFYPESGNQLSDKGYLEVKNFKIAIEKVSKKGDEILHHIQSDFIDKFSIGDTIKGEIDWNFRYGLMKAHSSQHIFSAVLKNKFDIDTLRAILSFEEVFLQISKKLNYNDLKRVLLEVNSICTSSHLEFSSKIINQNQAKNISSQIRSSIPDEHQVRLIEIQDLDLVYCGGTHVRYANEIGNLFLYEFKKGTEIRYYIGTKALQMNSNIIVDLLEIATKINTPIAKFSENVSKRLELLESTQKLQKDLSIDYLELVSKTPLKVINKIPLFYIAFDIDIKILNKKLGNFPTNSFIIVEKGNRKIRLLSTGEGTDANEIMQRLIKKFEGRGGGNSKSAQGVLEIIPKNLLAEIELLIKD
ncbi:MAG: alanine--tRNA ligase-related protein [Candidatus Thorarchaeota archaeon]